MKRIFCLLAALLLVPLTGIQAAAEPALIAHWSFTEGSGEVLHDISGAQHDGTIHGASWVRVGDGFGLQFGANGSFVDFGDVAALKPSGDFSFSAWVKSTAETFPDKNANWHLFTWEEYRLSGFNCRIDGRSGRIYTRSSQGPKEAVPQQGFSKEALAKDQFHFITVVKQGDRVTLFVDGRKDADVRTFKSLTPGHLPFTLSAKEQSLAGILSEVRLYDGAISTGDVVALYAAGAKRFGTDRSWVGKIHLQPFIYRDTHEVIIEADLRGILPRAKSERVVAVLHEDGKPVQELERTTVAESGKEDFRFDVGKIGGGKCTVLVSVREGDRVRAEEVISFSHPEAPPHLASPKEHTTGPLRGVPAPAPYSLEVVGQGGGFAVRIGAQSYPVESSFSYPHGGENRLVVGAAMDAAGEKEWTIKTEKMGEYGYRIVATGKHYRLTRELTPQPSRIHVKDHIENLTDADIGLALDNRVDVREKADVNLQALAAPIPPLFVRAKDHGLGLVPLDDIYQYTQATYVKGNTGGSKIAGLGIAKGAAHTLEWAVYPIATPDYYDLVNAIRRDEGLNGLTVDGCLSFSHSGVWLRKAPPEPLVKFGGLKYAASGALTKVADDPELSFQGIEFLHNPKESEALRKNYAEWKSRYPNIVPGFHVAYNIYATDQPGKLYADSLMLSGSGKHDMYANPARYLGENRRREGWAFFPYYATMKNSFGKDVLKSVEFMMDDIGVGMVWADGLLSGYAAGMGDFPTGFVRTLEPWDGFSVELDPATKTIRRKWGIGAALGKDVILEYIRRINAKGGRVWINHMTSVPRSFARQEAYWAAETNDGDARCASLHLSPAPHGLANPTQIATTQMVYDDIRAKLSWGSFFAYYWYTGNASFLTHPMITTEMYPLTIESIHAGRIQGRERIVTLNSGIHGWSQDNHLHDIRLFDARGRMTPHAQLTTADHSGTRTDLQLTPGQTAVIVRLPVAVRSDHPVNTCVTYSGNNVLELSLSGQASVTLQWEDKMAKKLLVSGAEATVNEKSGTIQLKLDGLTHIRIERE
ncbi:MAG: LamG-like jellyroll fold domain-containing protein [Verrucomicrobiota bacterium]